MKVIIESPFKNSDKKILSENLIYLNMVARQLATKNNLSPLFFHGFYTHFLNDHCDTERALGLNLSFMHHKGIDTRIITVDRGISKGMILGMETGLKHGGSPSFFSFDPDLNSLFVKLNKSKDATEIWESGLDLYNKNVSQININDFGDRTNYRMSTSLLREEVISIMFPIFQQLSKHMKTK